jgi:hypothetical protein
MVGAVLIAADTVAEPFLNRGEEPDEKGVKS